MRLYSVLGVLLLGGAALTVAATAEAQQQEPDTSVMKQPMDPENPTAFIILHRAELKLADSQVTTLQPIGAFLTIRTRAFKDTLDDLRPSDARPTALPTTPMTQEQRDSLFATRREYARVLGELHDAGRKAREQANAALNPEQQKKLQSLADNLAMEARMSKMRPSVQQQAGPPGASNSGVGGRPY
jgi:hypothetical protein